MRPESKNMPKITELKSQIVESISTEIIKFGLNPVTNGVFWFRSGNVVRIFQISFLDSHHASYFGTTKASFSLEFGGLYGSITELKKMEDFPKVHYCQIRGMLLKDYIENAPNKNLPSYEHSRNDIWWVDRSGENLNRVLESTSRVIRKELKKWLDRLIDYRYLCWYLILRKEKLSGFFGFGTRGSKARKELLKLFSKEIGTHGFLTWLINYYTK
ncbi:MAG: hypothetical protein AB1349_12740 [Elusimicrobiota bacterium]